MRIEKVVLLYEITPARLLHKSTPTKMEISVTREGLSIENEPIRLELDNRKFFDSIGIKGIQTQAKENTLRGKEAALEATGRYTRQKNAMTGPDAVDISQITRQQRASSVKTELAFLPEEKPEMSWSGGEVHMRIAKDNVEISWQPYKMEFTYIPYSVIFSVEKR